MTFRAIFMRLDGSTFSVSAEAQEPGKGWIEAATVAWAVEACERPGEALVTIGTQWDGEPWCWTHPGSLNPPRSFREMLAAL